MLRQQGVWEVIQSVLCQGPSNPAVSSPCLHQVRSNTGNPQCSQQRREVNSTEVGWSLRHSKDRVTASEAESRAAGGGTGCTGAERDSKDVRWESTAGLGKAVT